MNRPATPPPPRGISNGGPSYQAKLFRFWKLAVWSHANCGGGGPFAHARRRARKSGSPYRSRLMAVFEVDDIPPPTGFLDGRYPSSVTPVRVQKIIPAPGLPWRRAAEEWIREGRVRVNGSIVELGARADPDVDSVRVDGKRIRVRPGAKSYVLLNKPKGYVTTVDDPEGRNTVLDLFPPALRGRVKPAGRLDVQTEGLLLLTDDGDLARLVTHPSTGCPKEYRVKVSGVPPE